MKELKKEFIGRGEVRGFKFTQLQVTDLAFLYKVDCFGLIHYEVFRKHENHRFGNISYPTSHAFGKWAWTYKENEAAKAKFTKLNELKRE